MKQKIFIVAALLAVLLFAACNNAVTATSVDLDNIQKEYETVSAALTVSFGGSYENADGQEGTITFNNFVDDESILEAITLKPLSNAADDKSPLVEGTAVTYSIVSRSGNTVTIRFSLVGSTDVVQFHADASKLAAKNGAKLDIDGDEVKGEAADDDYYTIITVADADGAGTDFPVPTAVNKGSMRSPRTGLSFSAGFDESTDTTDRFDILLNTDYSSLGTGAVYDTADYKAMLDASLKIEKYNAATQAWDAVTYTSAYTPENATGTATDGGLFRATFSGTKEGDQYRARFENVQSLKTTTAFGGFIQRFEMDQRISKVEIVAQYGASIPAASVTILSDQEQEDAFTINAIYDSNNQNVKIELTPDFNVIGDLGMVESTLVKENFKLYVADVNSEASPIEIIDVKVFKDYTGDQEYYQIILDPEYKYVGTSDYSLLAGPALKTAGDETPGKKSLFFGDPSSIFVPKELVGWKAIL